MTVSSLPNSRLSTFGVRRIAAVAVVGVSLLGLGACGGGSSDVGADPIGEASAEVAALSTADKAVLDAALSSGTFDESVAAEKRWLYDLYRRLLANKRGSNTTTTGTTSTGTTSTGTTSTGTTSTGTTSTGTTSTGTTSTGTTSTGTTSTASSALSSLPLVQATGLVYSGAFRVPEGTSDQNTFAYGGGTAVAYNPANNSLIMAGLATAPRSAEVSIPAPAEGALGSLPRASLVQGFRDPTEGKAAGINPSGGETMLGGHLVYGGRLIVTAYTFYDATNSQSRSHFARPTSLSTTGQVQGPVALSGGAPARWLGGYMTTIPGEWRAAFGGPALTGLAGVSIASAASNGPAAAVFDPDALSSAKLVLGYGLDQALPSQYGLSFDQANPYWNFTSTVRGVVFPDNTRSVLFFGRHGTAAQQYGTDPLTGYKGYYAQPYVYQVWAYDALDLLNVKNGSVPAHSVKPYAVWKFSLPFESNDAQHEIGGAAYDPATRRIYVSQLNTDGNLPVIHVLRVATGAK